VVTHWKKVKRWFAEFWIWIQVEGLKAFEWIVEPFSHIPGRLGKWARDSKEMVKGQLAYLEAAAAKLANTQDKIDKRPRGPRMPDTPGGGRYTVPRIPRGGLTAAERTAAQQAAVQRRIEQLQFQVDRAEATRGLADDLRALRRLAGYLRERIRLTKNNLDLRKQLLDVNKQIADVLKQEAEQRAAAREARQFRLLGLGPTGEALIPRVRNLRRQLAAVREAIRGTFLDTRKERGLLANIGEILSGQLGNVSRAVREKIAEMLADIRRQLKDHQGEMSKWAHTTNQKIVEGLGLSPQQRRQLTQRLATIGPGMTVPPHHSRQFVGGGVVITGPVHIHGVQNPKQFEDHFTKRQAARPQLRRGAR
jgi:hypothetical protein